MRITEECVACQLKKQAARFTKPEEMEEVRRIIQERDENMSTPYLSFLLNQLYQKYYGVTHPFTEQKKQYNDLVLSMESALLSRIEETPDPVRTALFLARIGNYIDFGALAHVSEEEFLSLLSDPEISDEDEKTYRSFLEECGKAKTFMLLADNCGEIVLDKLLLRVLKKQFPALQMTVLVRGAEVSNDATPEDAVYTGLQEYARILDNGEAIAGTVYERIPEEARKALDSSDVILSKGQGNYESLAGTGRHIFFLFLCKCRLFTERFHVPALTGMFVEEGRP